MLNVHSAGSVRVQVSKSTTQPSVIIYGGAEIDMLRWQPLNVLALSKFSQCVRFSPQNQLLYTWNLYQGYNLVQNLSSMSLDDRYFALKPFALSASSVYTLQIVVSFISPSSYFPVQSQSSVLINVGRSGVAAKIKGGMFQTAFTNATLFLDATPSHDIDL